MIVVASSGQEKISQAGFNIFQQKNGFGQFVQSGKLRNKSVQIPFIAGNIKEGILLIRVFSSSFAQGLIVWHDVFKIFRSFTFLNNKI